LFFPPPPSPWSSFFCLWLTVWVVTCRPVFLNFFFFHFLQVLVGAFLFSFMQSLDHHVFHPLHPYKASPLWFFFLFLSFFSPLSAESPLSLVFTPPTKPPSCVSSCDHMSGLVFSQFPFYFPRLDIGFALWNLSCAHNFFGCW